MRVRAALLPILLAGALAAGCAQLEPMPEAKPAPAPAAAAVPTEAATLAELEMVFWHCDYVATQRGVLAAPMAACKFALDELKRRKFNGRYNALLDWWRENKAAEHRRVEQGERAGKI